MKLKLRVLIVSPFRGCPKNTAYAQAALLDSLDRGEAPFASHLLYPQVLDEHNREDREKGLQAEHAWLPCSDLVAVYKDRATTPGMIRAIAAARRLNIPIEERRIGVVWGQ